MPDEAVKLLVSVTVPLADSSVKLPLDTSAFPKFKVLAAETLNPA